MRRLLERIEGLGARGVVPLFLVGGLAIFLCSFLFTLYFLPTQAGDGDRDAAGAPPAAQDPPSASPTASSSPSSGEAASIEAQQEAYEQSDLGIEGARWEGEEVLVRGTWEGRLSSISCDLWEGEEEGEQRLMDWWDRDETVRIGRGGVAEGGLERGTFSRAFGEDVDGPGEDEPEEGTPYAVACSGTFSLGLSINDVADVEGNPPPSQASVDESRERSGHEATN